MQVYEAGSVASMFFNSFQFAGFFLVVWFAVAVVLRPRHWARLGMPRRYAIVARNAFLLVASYVFYGAWDYRFLTLIAFSTLVDFLCGKKMGTLESPRARRPYLWLSLATNLGLLGFFKYFDFFASSFADLVSRFGGTVHPVLLDIVLPVGISFYTFQTLSYTIDIYRGQLRPERSLLNFAAFVAFFPQLVAGPIERARDLLPQFRHLRPITTEKLASGAYLIAAGLFKKVVIADNLAKVADALFQVQEPTSVPVFVGTYAFAFQIYCDFSGYSDIARGTARCLGFELSLNFNMPYFAASPSEFWRRWHISLSTWLRDYLYIPLGGNRGSKAGTYRNLMMTMLLGGLWHGAAWTFVAWGALHGILLCLYRAVEPRVSRLVRSQWLRRVGWLVAVVVFFQLTCVAWLLFRAESIEQAWRFFVAAVSSPTARPVKEVEALGPVWTGVGLVGLLIGTQALQFWRRDLYWIARWPLPLRGMVYAVGVVLFVWLGEDGGEAFVYFQF